MTKDPEIKICGSCGLTFECDKFSGDDQPACEAVSSFLKEKESNMILMDRCRKAINGSEKKEKSDKDEIKTPDKCVYCGESGNYLCASLVWPASWDSEDTGHVINPEKVKVMKVCMTCGKWWIEYYKICEIEKVSL